MKLTRLESSQSKRGGWVLTASNQIEIRKLLLSLREDEYHVANSRAQSYWVTDQALMRVKNWEDYPALQSVRVPTRPSSPSRPAATPPVSTRSESRVSTNTRAGAAVAAAGGGLCAPSAEL